MGFAGVVWISVICVVTWCLLCLIVWLIVWFGMLTLLASRSLGCCVEIAWFGCCVLVWVVFLEVFHGV